MTLVFDPQVFTVKPPWGRRASSGRVRNFSNIRWSDDVPRSNFRARGAKKVGLAYERRVLDVLSAIYGSAFEASPVIRYDVGSGERRKSKAAIPDGILRFGQWVLVIEVKLAHTERVWEQLMMRYLPLVRALEPQRQVRTIEVCRSYDPAISLPGPHTLTTSLHKPGTGLEVLQWKL